MNYRFLFFTVLLAAIYISSFSQIRIEEKEVSALKQIEAPSFILEFEYNNYGYVIVETKLAYTNDYLTYKFEYEYDDIGNILLLKKYEIDNENWNFVYKEENEYNDDNQMVTKKIYHNYGSGFKFAEQKTYSYLDEQLLTVIFQNVSSDGVSLFNNMKQEITYNKQNQITKIDLYAWVSGDWIYTDIFNFEYDEFENLLTYSTEFFTGEEFVKNWQYQFHYNDKHELTERSFHYSSGTAWNPSPNAQYLYHYELLENGEELLYPNIYQFDELSMNLFQIDKKLVKDDYWLADCGGKLHFVESANYEYKTIVLNPDTIQSINYYENIAVSVYPNPTTGMFSVFSFQFSVDSIEIFDVLGRMQKIENRKSGIGKSEIEINISHLQSGIYFLKLATKKGTTTKKIIKY
jgi:hypothetical protein